MDKPTVSIIIPIYNTEVYLRKCVDSIINQTYDNLEIILVDDGSTDGSALICDELRAKDNRIKVIHKTNEGVVAARQDGLKVAKGQWLAFVDSDDWVEHDMYATLLAKASESSGTDIVWSGVSLEQESMNEIILPSKIYDNDLLLHKVLDGSIPGWSVNKIYRREFFERSNIEVNKECKMMEDTVMLVQFLLSNPSIEYVCQPFYHYNYTNVNSASHGAQGTAILKALPALEQIYSILVDNHLDISYFKSFARTLMRYKIVLGKNEGIKDAKSIFAYAHRDIRNYPLKGLVRYLYWTFFNIPYIGSGLQKLYSALIKN